MRYSSKSVIGGMGLTSLLAFTGAAESNAFPMTGYDYMASHAVDGVVPKHIATCDVKDGGVAIMDGDNLYASSLGNDVFYSDKDGTCHWENREKGEYLRFEVKGGLRLGR